MESIVMIRMISILIALNLLLMCKNVCMGDDIVDS